MGIHKEKFFKLFTPVLFHATLWIAAPVQGTGYQFPQVKEQVPPVRD